MRVVFINRFFYPDLSATSQMLSDLAFGLASRGHEVHVVCSRQLYEDAAATLPVRESVRGVHVNRAWSTRFGRTNLVGRALDYATFYLGASIVLWRLVDRRSVVVAKTDPPLISVVAAVVAAARGAHLVNWLQDVFPEVAERMGMRWAGGRAGSCIKALRDWSLRRAKANVVIGERMRELLAVRGIDTTKLPLIPNWADQDAVRPVAPELNSLPSQWQLDGKCLVMYSGNMGRAHDFSTVLDAAKLLSEHEHVHFVFVGGGARKAEVLAEVQLRGLRNVSFFPYQPKALLAESLSAGTLHLISLMPAQEGLIVPSKFYGVLAVGRPTLFVGQGDGEIARLVRRHQVGVAVALHDAEKLSLEILELAGDPSLRAAMGQRARALFLNQYTAAQGCAAWHSLLLRLANPA